MKIGNVTLHSHAKSMSPDDKRYTNPLHRHSYVLVLGNDRFQYFNKFGFGFQNFEKVGYGSVTV